jgi:hypothetical protein
MGNYEKMMKQYSEAHTNNSGNSSGKTYDLKNYFNTFLPDGVTEETKRIRILPPVEGETPFVVLWGHKKKVEDKWKTFPCLKHEKDEACPFCEARELLLAENTDGDKELAKNYSARKMYVVKVIDRNKEEEGVKFWRFNHNYKKDGPYDKIMKAIATVGHDVTDAAEGRDLNIDIARDQNKRPFVQTVTYPLESTPLSDDTAKVEEWTNDTRTWEDVYSVRTYDYLKIIVKGEIPFWDKDKKTYVSKNDIESTEDTSDSAEELNSELTMGEKVVDTSETPKTKEPVTANTSSKDDDDELPF